MIRKRVKNKTSRQSKKATNALSSVLKNRAEYRKLFKTFSSFESFLGEEDPPKGTAFTKILHYNKRGEVIGIIARSGSVKL